MVTVDPIKVEGLAEFSRNLRRLDSELPKGLRLAGNEAAELVVGWARARVARKTGAAAGTVRASSTRTEARVTGGSKRRSYYPWLDFGGRVGRKRSVARPFIKEGRYIYPGFTRQRDEVHARLVKSLLRVAQDAGMDVTE